MPDRPFEFDATDAAGVSHRYVCGYHNADEGLDISLWLLAHAGGIATGLVPAIKDAVGALVEDGGPVSSILDADASRAWSALSGALGSVSLEQIGSEWRKALLAPDAKTVLRAIFRHATRDGLGIAQ